MVLTGSGINAQQGLPQRQRLVNDMHHGIAASDHALHRGIANPAGVRRLPTALRVKQRAI